MCIGQDDFIFIRLADIVGKIIKAFDHLLHTYGLNGLLAMV